MFVKDESSFVLFSVLSSFVYPVMTVTADSFQIIRIESYQRVCDIRFRYWLDMVDGVAIRTPTLLTGIEVTFKD